MDISKLDEIEKEHLYQINKESNIICELIDELRPNLELQNKLNQIKEIIKFYLTSSNWELKEMLYPKSSIIYLVFEQLELMDETELKDFFFQK